MYNVSDNLRPSMSLTQTEDKEEELHVFYSVNLISDLAHSILDCWMKVYVIGAKVLYMMFHDVEYHKNNYCYICYLTLLLC